MKLSELEEMWAVDCQIDTTDLNKTLVEIPKLHSKYCPLLNLEKKNIAIARTKLKKLTVEKTEFITDGDL